jgi:hypothetical protein
VSASMGPDGLTFGGVIVLDSDRSSNIFIGRNIYRRTLGQDLSKIFGLVKSRLSNFYLCLEKVLISRFISENTSGSRNTN